MNVTPLQPLEIFLQPGDCYFGDRDTRIRTVLGSCVSMTFWHPQFAVGGMCHYMLPSREGERRSDGGPRPDGRYADEAMALLMKEIDAIGAPHREYQVKLFGGGNMFPETRKSSNAHVGQRNVEVARMLVKKHGFVSMAEHLGGIGHRNIIFDVWNGDVWVKHREIVRSDAGETVAGARKERRLG
jgi:chemotaxis protein CheD